MANMQQCAREGCETIFEAKVHNQRFCTRECTRVYTNKRILAQYHERKNRQMEGRVCAVKNCGTLLSRYNENELCGSCERKEHEEKLKAWGWQLDEWGERINPFD